MNEEDIRTQIAIVSGASGRDAVDLEKLTIGSAQQLVAVYQAAAAEHELTGLEKLVEWLKLAGSIVGPAASIAAGILGVASAAKALG